MSVEDAIIEWYWRKKYDGRKFQFSRGELRSLFRNDPRWHDIFRAIRPHIEEAYQRGRRSR